MFNSTKFSVNQKGFSPLLVVILIAAALLGGYFVYQKQTKPKPPIKACTQDAKLCPDGTSVGRVGPKCDFTPCSTSESSSSAARPVPNGTGDISNWKTYTDEKFQFQINYPTNAKIVKPNYKTIADSPSEFIIQYNLAECTKSRVNDCLAQFDVAAIPNQTHDLQSFVSGEILKLSGSSCKTEKIKLGQIDAIRLHGCVIGSFVYLKYSNYVIQIGYDDDPIANQILSTFKFLP